MPHAYAIARDYNSTIGGLVVFRIVTSTEVQKIEVKLFYHGTGFKKEKGRGEEKTPLVERKVYCTKNCVPGYWLVGTDRYTTVVQSIY